MARPERRAELGLLALVLLGAAALRVWRFDLAQVGYDESLVASLLEDWRLHGLFPLTAGIVSNTDFRHPPVWTYLMGLTLLPFNTPYAAVALGIGVGLLSVMLTWWVGRRWLGPWGGLAAATFFAGGFWSIILGRSPWQPAFLAPLSLMCLDALLLLAVRRRPWALVAACGWLALMAQVHYVAIACALVVPLAMWPARRVLRPVHVCAAVVAGLVPLLPFLIYELHPTVRLHEINFLAGQAAGGSRIDLESWDLLWTLAANGGAAGLGGPSVDGLRALLGRWSSLGLLGIPLVAGGLLVLVFSGSAPRRVRASCASGSGPSAAGAAGTSVLGAFLPSAERATGASPLGAAQAALRPPGSPAKDPWPVGGALTSWLLLAWVMVPVLALARHTLGVLFHYLYVDLPGIALAVGALVAWAATWRWRAALGVITAALGLYVAVSAATLFVVLGYLERADTHLGYGTPLRFSLAAGQATRAMLPPQGQVMVGGPAFDAEVLRFSIGYDVSSRIFDDACQPGPAAIYLLLHQGAPAAQVLAREAAPLLAEVPRPGDEYLVYGPAARQGASGC